MKWWDDWRFDQQRRDLFAMRGAQLQFLDKIGVLQQIVVQFLETGLDDHKFCQDYGIEGLHRASFHPLLGQRLQQAEDVEGAFGGARIGGQSCVKTCRTSGVRSGAASATKRPTFSSSSGGR
jgi:hypothetical protein